MRKLLLAILLTAATCAAQEIPAGPIRPNFKRQTPAASAPQQAQIVVPAGITVPLAMTQAVLAKTAKPGDSIYAETVFPVAVNNQMAIPAGTYVQGQIDTVTRPGRFSPHAQFQIHFTELVFANGYVAAFGDPVSPQADASSSQPAAAPATDNAIPAVSSAYVDVSAASDILLDNGTQIEMVLQIPLALDGDRVADAVRHSNPAQPAPFKSATLCRPTAGTPGTSDTVIPGSPGTPGTPDTVIPGGPGMPDTVIPGIPATPGTPPTIIPGDPGTPGTSCPGPPVVTSNTKNQNYKESFEIAAPAAVGGKQLSAGSYQVSWTGSGPPVQVDIRQNGNLIVSAPARFVILEGQSAGGAATSANAEGSLSLQALRFAGESFALYFDTSAE